MAMASDQPEQTRTRLPAEWLLLAAAVAVALWIRLRLLSMPMERDEGEDAYIGQLILHGNVPYRDAYTLKWPGTHLVYALIMVLFGQSDSAIRLGLLLANGISTASLFFLAKRLWGQTAAYFSATIFVLWSLSPVLLGTMAHATQFLVACCIPGYVLLMRGLDSRRLGDFAGCGFLLGMAMLMKQHAIFFVFHACLVVLWAKAEPWRARLGRAGLLFGAALVPFLLVCIYFLGAGSLGRFFFWTFTYARAYTTITSPALAWKTFVDILGVLRWDSNLWMLAAGGLVLLWVMRLPHRGFLTGFLLTALATVIPGFYFRQHYWVPVTPAASMLGGIAFWQLYRGYGKSRSLLVRRLPSAVFAGIFAYYFIFFGGVFFLFDPDEACRRLYPNEQFPALKALGLRLRNTMPPSSRLAVLGSEPQLYFYSGRPASTGYLYTFPLMENQKYAGVMQHQMVDEITKQPPDTLVFVQTEQSWFPQPGFDPFIFNWVSQYTASRYVPAELIDVNRRGSPVITGDAIHTYRPQGAESIVTYVRRPTG